jgi:hypothetical protein
LRGHNVPPQFWRSRRIDPNKPADAPEILLNREFGNSFSKMYMYKIGAGYLQII